MGAASPSPRRPRCPGSTPRSPGRVGQVSSCVAAPAPRPASRVLGLKLAAVGIVAAFGVAVCVPQFAAMTQPDPAKEYVAGHPAWAHVDHP